MLARLWHGRTPAAKAQAYLHLMRTVAVPDYQSIPGNRGAHVLMRIEDGVAHFQMLTYWDSLEAVKAFAGDDYLTAKYYDFDRDYLIELEPTAAMYEVW
jgi:heme-degrading monooxygenase HmoA